MSQAARHHAGCTAPTRHQQEHLAQPPAPNGSCIIGASGEEARQLRQRGFCFGQAKKGQTDTCLSPFLAAVALHPFLHLRWAHGRCTRRALKLQTWQRLLLCHLQLTAGTAKFNRRSCDHMYCMPYRGVKVAVSNKEDARRNPRKIAYLAAWAASPARAAIASASASSI